MCEIIGYAIWKHEDGRRWLKGGWYKVRANKNDKNYYDVSTQHGSFENCLSHRCLHENWEFIPIGTPVSDLIYWMMD